MSTTNAVLLVASATVVHDVFVPFVRRLSSDRLQLVATRAMIVVLALMPVWFAMHQVPLVQFIVLFQAKLVASFFFAPVVIGLNWERSTSAGALAAMLTGLVVCLLWSMPPERPLGLDAIFPGVAASIVTFVVVSLMTPARTASYGS
jgi:Na+/pantothenate symporter